MTTICRQYFPYAVNSFRSVVPVREQASETGISNPGE